MDINQKFEEFLESAPSKRFHQAKNKDGSIKTDRRFRAFKHIGDKARDANKKRMDESTWEMDVTDLELVEAMDMMLDEKFKFKSAKKGAPVDPDLKNKVMSKALKGSKDRLLAAAVTAMKKYVAGSSNTSTEFKAADIHKSYGLDKNLGMSIKDFTAHYKTVSESHEVNEGIRNRVKELVRGTKDKDLEKEVDGMRDSELKAWISKIPPKSAKRTLSPSDYHKYQYALSKHKREVIDEDAE